MKKTSVLVGLIGGVIISTAVCADEYSDAALGLCEKIKSCAVAQMDQQALTPEIRQMMQPMLDGMCDRMLKQIPEVAKEHALYKPSLACMKSLEASDCDSMQQTQDETPACREFEKISSQQ